MASVQAYLQSYIFRLLHDCGAAMSSMLVCVFCRVKDCQYAWRKLDGVSIDGRKWKVDHATKVGSSPFPPCCAVLRCLLPMRLGYYWR